MKIKKLFLGVAMCLIMPIAFVLTACGEKETPSYAVTFETHGGESITSQLVTKGEKATRPTEIPTKENYTFINWFDAETGGEVFDFDTAITANIKLHAQWRVEGFHNVVVAGTWETGADFNGRRERYVFNENGTGTFEVCVENYYDWQADNLVIMWKSNETGSQLCIFHGAFDGEVTTGTWTEYRHISDGSFTLYYPNNEQTIVFTKKVQ